MRATVCLVLILLLLLSAGPGSIALLLTLASPHQAPPLLLQPELARFYDSTAAAVPEGLPAVSVHGGAADMQVELIG